MRGIDCAYNGGARGPRIPVSVVPSPRGGAGGDRRFLPVRILYDISAWPSGRGAPAPGDGIVGVHQLTSYLCHSAGLP